VEALLEGIDGFEDGRALAAVEVLRQAGTPEARALLGRLAGGTPGHWLTRAARAALRDPARRPVP
jgi:hypothetical protein